MILAIQVQLGLRDHRVYRVKLVVKVHKGSRVYRAKPDPRALRGRKDLKATRVRLIIHYLQRWLHLATIMTFLTSLQYQVYQD